MPGHFLGEPQLARVGSQRLLVGQGQQIGALAAPVEDESDDRRVQASRAPDIGRLVAFGDFPDRRVDARAELRQREFRIGSDGLEGASRVTGPLATDTATRSRRS
jgi:hypothetical protein